MQRPATIVLTILTALAAIGCGQPGLPMPPSLNLPAPVTTLTADRTGNTITLHWTMPRETTDKQQLHGALPVQIYLADSPTAAPQQIATATFAADAPAVYKYTLPAQSINSDVVFWTLRLPNSAGRTAGPSNTASTLSGPAIPTPTNFAVTNTPSGVKLTWQPTNSIYSLQTIVHRHLVKPPPAAATSSTPKENHTAALVLDTDLTVPGNPGQAIDHSALLNATYSYSLQIAAEAKFSTPNTSAATSTPSSPASGSSSPASGSSSIDITTRSAPTAPLMVSTVDTFPPATPTGLAVIIASSATPISADLSWQPNTEPDIAGYYIYRAALGSKEVRINATPAPQPTYRDALPALPSTTRITYCVTAVDTAGNESPCSAPDTLTLP